VPLGPLYVEALQASVDANEPELAGQGRGSERERERGREGMRQRWRAGGAGEVEVVFLS
jgi:hypothetical protein